MIVTGNHYFKTFPMAGTDPFNWFLAQARESAERQGIVLHNFPHKDAKLITYHVNQGAWKGKCPDPDCRGYAMAWEEGIFICCSCMNGAAGHCLLRAVFPLERLAIDALLEVRPLLNRNWELSESLEDLRKENEGHFAELLKEFA